MKREHKTYLIQRNKDGEIMYLKSIEVGQFGTRVEFRYTKTEAILFLTFYEAAATMCYVIEQLDANLQDELEVITLK